MIHKFIASLSDKELDEIERLIGVEKKDRDQMRLKFDRLEGGTPLHEAWISVRTYNVLRAANVKFIEDIQQFTVSDILRLPNGGKKTLAEIEKLLRINDLKLKQ